MNDNTVVSRVSIHGGLNKYMYAYFGCLDSVDWNDGMEWNGGMIEDLSVL